MSFVMPKATVDKGVPKPTGKDVSLGKVEATRFAVLRFPGGRNTENEAKALAELRVAHRTKTHLRWRALLCLLRPAVDAHPLPPQRSPAAARSQVLIRACTASKSSTCHRKSASPAPAPSPGGKMGARLGEREVLQRRLPQTRSVMISDDLIRSILLGFAARRADEATFALPRLHAR